MILCVRKYYIIWFLVFGGFDCVNFILFTKVYGFDVCWIAGSWILSWSCTVLEVEIMEVGLFQRNVQSEEDTVEVDAEYVSLTLRLWIALIILVKI